MTNFPGTRASCSTGPGYIVLCRVSWVCWVSGRAAILPVTSQCIMWNHFKVEKRHSVALNGGRITVLWQLESLCSSRRVGTVVSNRHWRMWGSAGGCWVLWGQAASVSLSVLSKSSPCIFLACLLGYFLYRRYGSFLTAPLHHTFTLSQFFIRTHNAFPHSDDRATQALCFNTGAQWSGCIEGWGGRRKERIKTLFYTALYFKNALPEQCWGRERAEHLRMWREAGRAQRTVTGKCVTPWEEESCGWGCVPGECEGKVSVKYGKKKKNWKKFEAGWINEDEARLANEKMWEEGGTEKVAGHKKRRAKEPRGESKRGLDKETTAAEVMKVREVKAEKKSIPREDREAKEYGEQV